MNKPLLVGTFLAILAVVIGCSTSTEQLNERPTARNTAPLSVTVTNFVIVTNFVTNSVTGLSPEQVAAASGLGLTSPEQIGAAHLEQTRQNSGYYPKAAGAGGPDNYSDNALDQQTHPSNFTQQAASTVSINPHLSPEDIAYLKQQGWSDWQIANASYVSNSTPATQTAMSPTPPDLKGAIIYMDSFLGMANQTVPGDVISMNPQALKFRLMGKDYDYSGNYTVVLNTPRQHKNPYFGFGSPETAKILVLDDFGGQAIALQNATVWDKESNFIDVESSGKEWIYSGTYTIQN